jgi:DNA transposition AAA+ family ATPase
MKFDTAHTKNILAALDAYEYIEQAAQDRSPAIAMFTGKAGLGKSHTGEYLFIHGGGLLVRCSRSDTHRTFLQQLAKEVGLSSKRGAKEMEDYIVEQLLEDPRPIFVDECDYLADKPAVLEGIRDIYDRSHVPVILIGYEHLPAKIKGLPQLQTRIAKHVEFKPADFEDTELMAEALLDELIISREMLEDLKTQSKGNYRDMHTGLSTIERWAKSNGLSSVNLDQWADQQYFPKKF